MKALVCGGAGFIGSNIVRLLLNENHDVTVFDNLHSGYQENIEEFNDIEFVEGDIRDVDALNKVVAGTDVIFHLAASVGNKRSIDHPIDDSQINVIGTLNVLEAARHHDVRKVVYSSSAGIFGELKTLPIDETHPIEPDSPYGVSKLAGEKHCLAYSKLYDLDAVCLRYFNVYGVNQRYDAYGNVIPIFGHRILNNEPITIFGDGGQTRDFVNVKDVAKANVLAATTDNVNGAFNIASGTRITINHLAKMMCQISGIDTPIEYGPERPGDVRDSLADISLARENFGFVPTVDIEEGLVEYIEWARKAGI